MEHEPNSEIISILKDVQRRITNIEKKLDDLSGQMKKRSAGVRHDSPSARTYGAQAHSKNARPGGYAGKNSQIIRPYGKKQNDALKRVPKKNVGYDPTSKKIYDK